MRTVLLSGLMGVVLSGSGHSQWLENFDSYTAGPLAAQSQWELWNKADANVSNRNPFTPPRSARISADQQVLYDMANTPLGSRPQSGQWILSIKTLIFGSDSGNVRFKVLNTYPTDPNFSVVIDFDLDVNLLTDKASKNKLPILNDEWVSLIICIDLDTDLYTMYYGDQLLAQDISWTSGLGSQGKLQIAMVELNSLGNASAMYFDDVRLEKGKEAPCLTLVSSGNPASSGGSLTLTSSSPSLGVGDSGAVFIWTVNGAPFVALLLLTPYDNQGQWSITATVPPGLSGLQIGLKAFAVPSVGYTMVSNEDLIVFL